MRRITITISAALMVAAIAPASALARHHHRRHHSRTRHARIERFGRDVTTASPTASSADNAGTVQSFSNGRLTILLSDGSTVSGQVTRDTELECTAPEQSQSIHADGDRSGDDPSGEDQMQSSGDDQGDAAEQNENQAEDQNEDQAEDQNEDQNENEMESCSVSNLSHGTVVHEAELRLSSAGSVWKKVELGS